MISTISPQIEHRSIYLNSICEGTEQRVSRTRALCASGTIPRKPWNSHFEFARKRKGREKGENKTKQSKERERERERESRNLARNSFLRLYYTGGSHLYVDSRMVLSPLVKLNLPLFFLYIRIRAYCPREPSWALVLTPPRDPGSL